MVAPRNEFPFDLEIIQSAAENYRRRAPEREKNKELIERRRYDQVDGKERLTKRVNRLLHYFKEAPPQAQETLPVDVKALVEIGGVGPEEVDNPLIERVIGATRDFLSIVFLEKGLEAGRSVARIVTQLGGGRVSCGTGFLVSPRLLLTNWHVLRTEDDAASSAVEFDYQLDRHGDKMPVERYALDPRSFFYNSKDLDFALVAVETRSERGRLLKDRGFHRLIKDEGKASQGLDCLNIIQHPRGDLKQIVIRENRLVDLPDIPGWAAHYEGDTEPGSSGSPVFNDQWEVIALHHSGVPRMDDAGNFLNLKGGIWRRGDDPEDLDWVANEGIRISKLMKHLADVEVRKHERELLKAMLDQAPTIGLGRNSSPDREDKMTDKRQIDEDDVDDSTNVRSSIDIGNGSVTVTIPLQISISLGAPLTSTRFREREKEHPVDLSEKIEIDPNYESRNGYDQDFTGFSAPLPKLSPAIKAHAAKVDGAGPGNRFELKYHHYSVIMNGKRRIAFVSAVNFDANPKFTHKREKGKEVWSVDPRIPSEMQSSEENYGDPDVDRGHLARRADAGWGGTKKEAKLANDDTFHFTNCSPQHAIFNQATKARKEGLLLWGNLEEHIAKQARDNNKRLSVFNGPILRSNDPKHRGLQLPREFYKIVIFENDEGEPRALAFLLSQRSLIADLPEEEFEIGPYEPFQVRVREIEAKTKSVF